MLKLLLQGAAISAVQLVPILSKLGTSEHFSKEYVYLPLRNDITNDKLTSLRKKIERSPEIYRINEAFIKSGALIGFTEIENSREFTYVYSFDSEKSFLAWEKEMLGSNALDFSSVEIKVETLRVESIFGQIGRRTLMRVG